jgi:hypothetical protein
VRKAVWSEQHSHGISSVMPSLMLTPEEPNSQKEKKYVIKTKKQKITNEPRVYDTKTKIHKHNTS